jgi:hypothetical protein
MELIHPSSAPLHCRIFLQKFAVGKINGLLQRRLLFLLANFLTHCRESQQLLSISAHREQMHAEGAVCVCVCGNNNASSTPPQHWGHSLWEIYVQKIKRARGAAFERNKRGKVPGHQ